MNEKNQNEQLIKMKEEIESLESEIKYNKLVNFKIKAIRNLKITAKALRLVAPYTITAGIAFCGVNHFGCVPYNERKAYSNVMTEFDNVGNIRIEQQYYKNNGNSILYYCSKWEKCDDEFYSRTAQAYSIRGKSFEDIMELFKKEDLKLEDVLGEPYSNIKETKNNLTEDEIQEEAIIKAVIYKENKDDYIIYKTTVGENIAVSAIWIILAIASELIPLCYREYYSSFNFLRCVNEIKAEHQLLDIDNIAKKLELKRDDYDRLMR